MCARICAIYIIGDVDNDRRNRYNRAPSTEPQERPLISIIVPAYNCGKFITKALDSLINQDIPERNYEIIITDDGSTDQTGIICDTYAQKFPFIHVTHTDNFGASHARNIALPKCGGEYITFCDADDYQKTSRKPLASAMGMNALILSFAVYYL